MLKNIQPVVFQMLSQSCQQRLLDNLRIFDQEFCPLMKEHPYYTEIKDEKYDRYRNLHLVWQHECLAGKYGPSNTLLIDSDNKKVQLFLDQSITHKGYSHEDVTQMLSSEDREAVNQA